MPTEPDLLLRVAQLERKLRIAGLAAVSATALGIVAITGTVASRSAAAAPAAPAVADKLSVHELDVVDPNGVVRVKLAAPLPAPVIDGEQKATRGGRPQDTISGVLLFDADGVERSGYATVDRGYANVLLTLDDPHQQHAMFIAEPTGATTLRLFNGATHDRVDVAVDGDGPSITMVRRGREVWRQPAR